MRAAACSEVVGRSSAGAGAGRWGGAWGEGGGDVWVWRVLSFLHGFLVNSYSVVCHKIILKPVPPRERILRSQHERLVLRLLDS